MSPVTRNKSPIAIAVYAALSAAIPLAHAAEPQLEGIVVTGDRPATAPYVAPTQGSLDAGEPQSVIGQRFIENNLTAGANYTDIINIAPSVADTTPNGKGNAESLNLSIRGFQDGQFNVTFDGIPFSDTGDFTHHTTSYFTANTIGKVIVDRGPGTAAQVGNATNGGTVALVSKDPTVASNFNSALTLGTWRTNDLSAEINTGTLAQAGGGRAMLTLTSIQTDGAMSNNALNRKNAFFKFIQPMGTDTTVTFAAMYNTVHQNVSQFGATLSQLGQFGPHYSLSTNPSSDSYYGFNFDDIHTDFEYVEVKTTVSGVRIDNKTYTSAYYHGINETNDPSLALGSKGQFDAANGSGLPGGTANPTYNNVAGQKGLNNYRAVGDVLRGEGEIGPGTLRGGIWLDREWNDRALYNVDWTANGTLDPYGNTGSSGVNSAFQRYLHDQTTTVNPFVEYEYRPIEAWNINAGLRWTSLERDIAAAIDPVTLLPYDTSHKWSALQPSLYSVYHVLANASVFAQYARGFLAPKDNLIFAPPNSSGNVTPGLGGPQRTQNIQVGGTWKADNLTASADYYHIRFDNFYTTNSSGSKVLTFGGDAATFKGEELEATYVLGAGFSLYGNYSHNTQTFSNGLPVQFAPDGTHTLGLLYDDGRLYGSVLSKYIGSTVQPSPANAPQAGPSGPAVNYVNNGSALWQYTISGYTVTDATIGYTFKQPTAGIKDFKVHLTVSDIANNQSIYYAYGNTLNNVDMFMTLPGRSYMLGMSADF